MLDALWRTLADQLANDFFAGGLALGLLGVAGAAAARLPGLLKRLAERRWVATVVVDGRSELFAPLLAWLAAHPGTARCRRLAADLVEAADGERRLQFSPGPGAHLVRDRGRWLWVARKRPEERDDGRPGRPARAEILEIRALARDPGALRPLLAEALARFGDGADRLAVHGFTEYDDWVVQARLRRRPLASLALAPGVAERLLADAQTFLAAEAWYAARGIPWRRGYLLHGPPGTGKTSAVRALAGELGLGLSVVNLAAPHLDDQKLAVLLATAPARSALLVEDVDAAFAGRARGEAGARLSFSGLLNALDGVLAQEGRLLFLTTNHPERLDPALVRPGRVDVRQEIGLAGPDAVRRLFLAFYPGAEALAERFVARLDGAALAPAALQGFLLSRRDDPDAALRDADQLLREAERRDLVERGQTDPGVLGHA